MNAWNKALESIQKKPATFLGESNCKLSVCIVEPRLHNNLGPVLWQIAKVYPNNEINLHVFYGKENKEYIKDICSAFKNVNFHDLNVSNLTLVTYSHLLTSLDFWLKFKSEYVLVIQTDSLLLRKIDDHFFSYDYVGAPWRWGRVGNGGFSLRKVSFMIECVLESSKQHPEDVYFSTMAYRKGKIPNVSIAKSFSVEHLFYKSPVGIHQAYNFMTEGQMKIILRNMCVFEKDVVFTNYYSLKIVIGVVFLVFLIFITFKKIKLIYR